MLLMRFHSHRISIVVRKLEVQVVHGCLVDWESSLVH